MEQKFNKGTSSGTLYGRLNNGLKPVLAIDAVLNDLTDVNIENPQKNDILYNDGKKWINKSISEVIGGDKVWVLDGGNAFGHKVEEVEPPKPEYKNYAEESISILNELINGEDFQKKCAMITGLDGINMNDNVINVVISGKFSGILDYIYNNDKVSEMMGRIVSSIYNNINYGNIRHSLDELETDLWIEFDNAKSMTLMEEKIFIYYSDESFGFLNFRFRFTK